MRTAFNLRRYAPQPEHSPMRPDQPHRCTVQHTPNGAPYLAFEPSSGERAAYSNSLFTLDLVPGATSEQAHQLAAAINALLRGVSTTIF